MSKITFRADEDLVERIEARDASKSEIMRDALRAYLDGDERAARPERSRDPGRSVDRDRRQSLDGVLAERVDELVAERLAAWEARERAGGRAQDVNIDLTLETDAATRADATATRTGRSAADSPDASASDSASDAVGREPSAEGERACGQCGESLSDDHVYCPNCGEKAARRVFCECGDEVRSDWAFCPSCGRRTPAADVLDRS